MKFTKLLGFAAVCTAFSGAAGAQALTGTLQQVDRAGMITLGVRDSSPPFSYSVGPGKYTGYGYEIMMKIFDNIKKTLHKPDLKYRLLPITSQNRIALVKNGTYAIECGSTTNNANRAQQVGFSINYFAIGTRLLTAKDSGIHDFPDLKGQNVVTIAGSTSEKILQKMNVEKKMGMNILSLPETSQAFLALQQGRAKAFMIDDAILYAVRSASPDPSKWVVVGKPQSFEAYACMLPKGDAELKKVADSTILDMIKSGQMNALYTKWFEKPIPPNNVSLDFPMSDIVKQILAKPSDQGFQ